MKVVMDSTAKLKGKNVKIKRAHFSYYVYYKTRSYINLRMYDVDKVVCHDRGYKTTISGNTIRLNRSAIIAIGSHHLINRIKKDFGEINTLIMKQIKESGKNE